jgi:hypothetical protein
MPLLLALKFPLVFPASPPAPRCQMWSSTMQLNSPLRGSSCLPWASAGSRAAGRIASASPRRWRLAAPAPSTYQVSLAPLAGCAACAGGLSPFVERPRGRRRKYRAPLRKRAHAQCSCVSCRSHCTRPSALFLTCLPPVDGYCNSRVAEFDASGAWVRDFKLPEEPEQRQALELPHR